MRIDGLRVVAVLLVSAVMAARSATGAGSAGESRSTIREERTPLRVTWQVAIPFDRAQLVVKGSDDLVLERELVPGEALELALEGLEDGEYVYELRVAPAVDSNVREALTRARDTGDGEIVRDLKAQGVIPEVPLIRSGNLRIEGGRLVLAGDDPEPVTAAAGREVEGTRTSSEPAPKTTFTDSLCVGFDCPASPSFGDSTILMMENNTRIKFDDTSNTGSFPNQDWAIVANDSANGGANRLFIQNCGVSTQGGCSGNAVFSVEAGAPNNALVVDAAGELGLGTATPVVEVHTVDGDSPTLRLQQDGSSGFTPQVWDVAGNEANFFVRDATNGGTLPFKIRPGALSDSLVVGTDGNVGVGVLSPLAPLHVMTSGTDVAEILIDQNGVPGGVWALRVSPDGTFNIGLGDGSKNFITLKESGAMATSGAVNAMSDRASKTGFAAVDTAALLAALATLDITRWSFIAEGPDVLHIGPTAQDFRAAFGLGEDDRHITLTDLGGVALAAVQGLLEQIEMRDRRIEELEKRLELLESRLPPAVDAP